MDKSWTEENTKKFIRLRIDRAHLFTGKKNSAQVRYKEILGDMELEVTPKQAAAKWQNLVAKYKDLKNPPTGKGVEEDEITAMNWKYFEELDKYFSSKHVISPELLISSTPSIQNECVIETINTPSNISFDENSDSEWDLEKIRGNSNKENVEKSPVAVPKKRKNPYAFFDMEASTSQSHRNALVEIPTPPKKSASMKAKEITDAKIDKLIDLSQEGNAILSRGVTALEKYLEFKMSKEQ